MANIKAQKENALAIIDAAVAILNKFPALDTTNVSLSLDTTLNPFSYLMDAFKSVEGYDKLLEILSNFIVYELPAVELGVKGVLIANLKNILNCSLNPFISDELLRDGIIFNLNEIDITDTLRYNPLDKIGRYYYFGCEDCKIPDDVKKDFYDDNGNVRPKDMNVLLWYMKTRAGRREVWGRKSPSGERETIGDKQKKADGIITLEYNERSSSVTDSEGNNMNMQTPYNNCLHVFIGNTKETYESNEVSNLEANIEYINELIKQFTELKTTFVNNIDTIKQNRRIVQRQPKDINPNNSKSLAKVDMRPIKIASMTSAIDVLEYVVDHANDSAKNIDVYNLDVEPFNIINNALKQNEIDYDAMFYPYFLVERDEVTKNITKMSVNGTDVLKICENGGLNQIIETLVYQKLIEQNKIAKAKSSGEYRPINLNYYYRHTLVEFNFDYIMSLKLFDEKVIAAQLIDSLCGLATLDLGLSYKQQLIRNEIKKMVQMVVNTDDAVVSDCFFSFSNDEFDAMMQKSELQKAGLFTVNGEENGTKQIDVEELLNTLNDISPDASQETIQKTIKSALGVVSGNIAGVHNENSYEAKDSINFGIRMNFIENLMNNLAYVIAQSVLSPKVYLLLLINLQLIGRDTNFNLEGFITQFRQLLVKLLREIRDRLIAYLVQALMDILGDLAKEIAVKISVEQAMYYTRLIKRIIACLKRKGSTFDWQMDKVEYADIYNDDTEEPVDKEC